MEEIVVRSMKSIRFVIHKKLVDWGWKKPLEDIVIEVKLLFRRYKYYVWDDMYYRYMPV